MFIFSGFSAWRKIGYGMVFRKKKKPEERIRTPGMLPRGPTTEEAHIKYYENGKNSRRKKPKSRWNTLKTIGNFNLEAQLSLKLRLKYHLNRKKSSDLLFNPGIDPVSSRLFAYLYIPDLNCEHERVRTMAHLNSRTCSCETGKRSFRIKKW